MSNQYIAVADGSEFTCARSVRIVKGGSVPIATLRKALADRGLSRLMPRETSDEVALRRAVQACKPSKHPKVSAGRGVWTVHLQWQEGLDKVRHAQKFSVKIVGDKPTVTFQGNEEAYFRLGERLAETYSYEKGVFQPEDIGLWWKQSIMSVCDALPDGDRHIVPKARFAVLAQLMAIVNELGDGYRCLTSDLVSTDEGAMGLLIEGIEEHARRELAEIQEFLDKHAEETPEGASERHVAARRVRLDDLQALKAKVQRFSRITRAPLLHLEQAMNKIRMQVAGAFVTLQAQKEGRATAQTNDAAINRFRLLETSDAPVNDAPVVDEGPDSADRRFGLLEID